MKNIKEIELAGKKVLLRADLNVPIGGGEIEDDERIKKSVDTIKEIVNQQANLLVIISHLGRPNGVFDYSLSLKPVMEELKKYIEVEINLLSSLDDLEKIKKENERGVYLLENIRFWSEEERGNDEFAKRIASGFDVYVNDGFSCSHRNHASFTGFPKYTKEKCAGLLFNEELDKLTKVRDTPHSPAVAIIGGAKFKTKLPVIENLKSRYDYILVGGIVANEVLDEKLDLGEKVLLPVDFAPEGKENQRLDIGSKTIDKFKEKISQAETIIWNGPMGKFEDEEAANGTREIMKAVTERKEIEQVIGGGETLEAVEKFGNFSDFDYVSMSGGAMLEFLAGKELPGVKALEN